MGFGYEGSKVRLVPMDEERHFENALRWINDPEVTEWLAVGDFPMARLAEREWFANAQQASEKEAHFAIETLDGEHLGFSTLFKMSLRHGTAESGSLIGAKEYWGKGFGSDAARVRAHYAFHVLGLRVLYSAYFAGNERSRHMQEAAGYREWGRQPGLAWKRGEYRDMVHTALTREDWMTTQESRRL